MAKKSAAKKTTAKKTVARKTAGKKTAARKTARKTAAKKSGGKKKAGGRKAAARELIDTGSDKRYVRRGSAGKFKESDDVGKSLAVDRRTKAKTRVKSGQGDRGDR